MSKEALKRARLKILSGSVHQSLVRQIEENLGGGFRVGVNVSKFEDGETHVSIDGETVRRSRVLIVHSSRPHNVNNDLMQLFQLAQAAYRANALEVNVLWSYLPYARQDRKDQPRVPISAKLIIKILELLGVRSLTCFDLHSAQIQGFSFLMPIDNLWPDQLFAPYIIKNFSNLGNTVLLSPDAGARKRAGKVQEKIYQETGIGLELPVAHKVRDPEGEPHIESIAGKSDLRGQNVVIVDDMACTCSTLVKVAKKATEFSPNSVRAICSHGLFINGAVERLKASPIEEIVITDSVPEVPDDPMIEVLSLAPSLSTVVEKAFLGESVSKAYSQT